MTSNTDKPAEVKYRHEFKYLINELQLQQLKLKLPEVMDYDSHVGADRQYTIRSLYFDSYDNACYYENENGTDPREKFRVRIYNGSLDRISLELKRKERGKTLKSSCRLDLETSKTLIFNENPDYFDIHDDLLRKLYLKKELQLYEPKIIVEYDRIPFVCDDGNVRITLDLNLRASTDIDKFLDSESLGTPILPVGTQLLEVKYDEFLPDYIYRTIQTDELQYTAFSKYYLCRKAEGIL